MQITIPGHQPFKEGDTIDFINNRNEKQKGVVKEINISVGEFGWMKMAYDGKEEWVSASWLFYAVTNEVPLIHRPEIIVEPKDEVKTSLSIAPPDDEDGF